MLGFWMCLEVLLLAGSIGKLQLNFRNSAMQMIIGCRFVLKVRKLVAAIWLLAVRPLGKYRLPRAHFRVQTLNSN